VTGPTAPPAATVLLESLGLVRDGVDRGRLAASDVAALASGERTLEWVHAGMADVPVGQVIDALRRQDRWLPPRTGHIGNWGDIRRGRSVMIDYNKTICTDLRIGTPLVYAFTETEADDGTGDWIYLPGSVVERGQRRPLALVSFDGSDFVARERNGRLLVPFAFTRDGGALQSLPEYHRSASMTASPEEAAFVNVAERVAGQADRYVALTEGLLREALRQPNRERSVSAVIGRVMTLDGRAVREPLTIVGDAFRLGDGEAMSAAEVARLSLEPFLAAARPDGLADRLPGLPWRVPLVSNTYVSYLRGAFETHHPTAGDSCPGDYVLHPEWGALAMAGYPPKARGHFTEKAHLRDLRFLVDAGLAVDPTARPVAYVVLPASIFTLLATDAHPDDAAALEELFRACAGVYHVDPGEMAARVTAAAAGWWAASEARLSPYFRRRWSARRSVANDVTLPDGSSAVVPDSFRDLTMRQASMLVGSLLEVAA